MKQIVVGYAPGSHGDDATALGRVFGDVLETEPHVVTVTEGAPARELARIAAESDTALVAIGSSHRGAFGRIALGSVGAALIGGAPCAVAVAPRGYAERETQRLLRISVAFDGGAESRAALDSAVAIAGRTRARLSILTAADISARGVSAPVPTGGGPAVVVSEQQAMQGVLRSGLDRVPEGLPVDGRLLLGPAAAEIGKAAAADDLLVVGPRGHGTVGRTLLGSVSTELIHHAECPVVVLPRGAGEDPLGLGAPDPEAG